MPLCSTKRGYMQRCAAYPLALNMTLSHTREILQGILSENLAPTWSSDVCRHHIDRVKKLITEPGNPNLIISAAEDSSGLASPPPLSFSMQTDQTAHSRITGLAIICAGLYMPCCTIREPSWVVALSIL